LIGIDIRFHFFRVINVWSLTKERKERKMEGKKDGMIRNSCFMRLFVIIRVDRVISQFWSANGGC
jgi:hypothetical protein